jgi:hypothetical protein
MALEKYRRVDTACCLIVAALAAWAVSRHPYSYYTLVRWLAFIGGAYMAWRLYKSEMLGLAILFGCTALLFNPVAPFYLRRHTWEILDVACAGLFLFAAHLTTRFKPG